jgi:hypothetical protein
MGGSIYDLVPELIPFASALVDAAGAAGLQPRITSTVRTNSEQRRLYNRFLAGQAGYPVAPPGSSAHEYGEAFDMVTSPMDALADVGYTWQQWGGAWNPADAVHFELPGASERAKQKGLESPWYVELAAGIPLSIPLSMVLAFLGIPASQRKYVTPEQARYLRQLAIDQGLTR